MLYSCSLHITIGSYRQHQSSSPIRTALVVLCGDRQWNVWLGINRDVQMGREADMRERDREGRVGAMHVLWN